MIKQKRYYRVVTCLMAFILCISLYPAKVFATNTATKGIQIDGKEEDWKGYKLLSSADSGCSGWIVVKDSETYYFYAQGSNLPKFFEVTYADGTQGNANAIQMTWDNSEVKGGWYQDIAGAKIAKNSQMVEFSVPANFFANQEFTIRYCGVSLSSKNMKKVGEKEESVESETEEGKTEEAETETEEGKTEEAETATEEGKTEEAESETEESTTEEAESETEESTTEETETATEESTTEETETATEESETEEEIESQPVYNGIVIDGKFTDWDAVSKVEVSNEAIHSTSMVFDGDWVYIYLSAPLNYSVSGAGSHGNGKYQIETDLGKKLVFQINLDGTVSGVEGIEIAHSDLTWGKEAYYYEIAIPKSALPTYLESISFGLYLGETFVSNVANLQEEDQEKNFNGIVYDGQYDDWTYYPHTVIEYATAGTQETVDDAEGALYSEGSTLYGHVVTMMPAHLQEAGGEFSSAITIRVNKEHDFYPRLVAVDSEGNINWSPRLQGLSEGNYEFYLVDTQGWTTASNITELNQQGNDLYGKMHMTIGPSSDEMEFEIDIEALARKFNMDANDIKTLGAQFGRIGQQWIQTAGTSTGAYIGIGLCLFMVGSVLLHRKRKGEMTVV